MYIFSFVYESPESFSCSISMHFPSIYTTLMYLDNPNCAVAELLHGVFNSLRGLDIIYLGFFL